MPNLAQMVPGMESMATMMMKQKMAGKGIASIEELRTVCIEAGVKLIACQMTVDLFDFKKEDFIEDIEFGGAATFFEFAGESDVNLFI
jgi:peroxiredoxin family protein